MKTEQKQLLFFIARAIALLVFASLYAVGGSEDFWGGQLWIRRWLAPFILVVGGFLFSLDWRSVIAYPLMAGALSLPYGADETWEKVLLRLSFGFACGIAFNIPNLLNKRWLMAGFGMVLAMLASVILGVWNPAPDAIIEQGAIALLIGFTYIFGTRKKED